MKLKLFSVLIFLIFIINSSISSSEFKNFVENKNDLLDGSYLMEKNGFKILFQNGSYYEMGFQHGYLLKDEIKESINTFIDYFTSKYNINYEEFLKIWNKIKGFIPENIIDEMQGVSDGSGVLFEKIAVAQTVRMKYHCLIVSISKNASINGKLYFVRSLDWSSPIKNFTTKKYLNNHIMFVRNPINGFASMFPGYAGFIVSYGGLNENGICIAASGSWSSDETYYGLTERFRIKEVLDNAYSIDEALDLINRNKTCGINFIISDSKTNESVVVEQTANITYVGKHNSSVESNKPCFKIDNVLRRTNFFINKTTAKTQRYSFDPRSPLNLLVIFKTKHKYGLSSSLPLLYYMHYKVISRFIIKNYGKLDLNNTMFMIRNLYSGKNNMIFKLNNFILKNFETGYYPSHQWVCCPETGDMIISFSESKKCAFQNSIHLFNLFYFL